jgi:hypothetical protein
MAEPTFASPSSPLGCSITWGLYVTGIPWDDSMTAIRNLDTSLDRHSQIVHYYAQWGDPGPGVFSNNQPRLLNNVHGYTSVGTSGALPLVNWEPWNPAHHLTPDFPLRAIADGKFDSYIDGWAAGLKGLGFPVLLNFAHEMNGNWYPWGYRVNGNTPADYIAAYRHVHDRFTAAGANNVKFVWNVNVVSSAGPSVAAFYPGDAYVDWMAIDGYNRNTSWTRPYRLFRDTYAQLAALNRSKPIMIAETGSQDRPPRGSDPASQAAWVALLAQTLPQAFPRVQALIWFSEAHTPFDLAYSASERAALSTGLGRCSAT